MSKVRQELIARFTALIDGPLTLDKAIAIAVVAHAGKEDKGQNAYIRHPLRVMEKMDCEDEMVVAVCHDVVEDCDFISLEDMEALGYTVNQCKALDALTKREGEDYDARIQRVLNSYVAKKVKIQDIRDNLQVWRLKNRKPTEKDFERMKHYYDALFALGVLGDRY